MNIIHLNTVDSTNNYAKELLKTKPENFTFVVAKNQTSGRGQFGNTWLSQDAMNLTFSLILYPENILAHEQFYISKFISLQVIDFLNNIHENFEIKWPNDIYFANKKIGGILIENSLAGNKISYSIIGIGLNINQIEFPESLQNPISLKQITKKNYDLKNIISDLQKSVIKSYNLLINRSFNVIDNQYHNLLFQKNKFRNYKDSKGIFTGKILGTEASGKLIIETKTGELRKYFFKEIEFLFNTNS